MLSTAQPVAPGSAPILPKKARRSARAIASAVALTLGACLLVPLGAQAVDEPVSSDPAAQEEPIVPAGEILDPSALPVEAYERGEIDATERAAMIDALSAYVEAAGGAPEALRIAGVDLLLNGLESEALPENLRGAVEAALSAVDSDDARALQAFVVPQRVWPLGTATSGAPGLVHQLPVVHRAQITNFYCGVAAAVQALLAIPGGEVSKMDGQALSQKVLASDRYMMTDRNRKTSWAQRRMTIGMNRWLTGSDAGPYRYLGAPSGAAFVGAVDASMKSGRPMFVDAEEDPATGRYNNHADNGATYSHIMTVRGWNTGTGQVQFVDPWSMAYFDPSRGTRIRPMFWYDGPSFAVKFLDDFGMIY